ncbi:NUDIX hydrolase [Mangrovibacterium lignilyticum]|uniref:NUDIX hydrolase n=1 Tax=Mangrovibacterium lignilyticum TaxID=2668052 RepID=UPI0013CF7E82|nr:NUDIX hydrolase [Mangrovibacterium lignilyticum]
MILKSVSIDCVIFGFDGNSLKVLLSKQNPEAVLKQLSEQEDFNDIKELYDDHPSFVDPKVWNVFGAHIPADKDLDEFARDLLYMATGMNDVFLKQFHCFGNVDRVPNNRVLTIGYYALINPSHYIIRKSIELNDLKWFNLNSLPKLSFDHGQIIKKALEHLRHEVRYQPIGFHLLPDKFTLTEFQTLYEVILDKKMDTRNFRKKIAKMELLIDSNQKQQNVSHRAAKLYQFDEHIYHRLKEEGLKFRIE